MEQQKEPEADKVFLAEGPKLVGDLLGHFSLSVLAGNFRMAFPEPPSLHRNGCHGSIGGGTFACQPAGKLPNKCWLCSGTPDEETDISVISHSLCLALDDVQDPVTSGTIVRLADWFGIEHIFCSSQHGGYL